MTIVYDEIMVRYGELSTKGKNRGFLSIVWPTTSKKFLLI